MLSRFSHLMRSGGRSTRFALAVGAVAVLALLLVLGDAVVNFDRIHAGVTVAGEPVGRMTKDDAVTLLTEKAEEAQSNEIILTARDSEWTVLPPSLGTKIDVESTVEDAYAVSREQSFFRDLGRRFSLYFSERDIDLRGTVRTSAMDALVEEVSADLDDPPVNAALSVQDGHVQISEGEDGTVVDRDLLRNDLKQLLFSFHATELAVPMKTVEPDIKGAETAEAVAAAETMIGGPVELTHGESSWTLEPDRIAAFIAFTAVGEGDGARLMPLISAEKADEFLTGVAESVNRAARKATWETNGETATIVPHQTGLALNREKTAQALTTAAQSATGRTATVAVEETPPDRTTEQAEEMGVTTALARYSTEFDGSDNRRDNVQRAAEIIDGTLIGPGQEFDFNSVVGQRTADNGFKTAPVIINGELEDSLGGGICQVSTTLFNAAFFAGLDITSRRNHSLYISHYPKGRDATVSWGGPEFRFRNDTNSWILIKSASSRSSVLFVIYGTPTGREVSYTTGDWYDVTPPTEKRINSDALSVGEEKVTDQGQTGRKITVTRTVTANGETIHNDTFVSNYPMKPKVIEVGTKPRPTTTTTAAPEPSPASPSAPATTTTTAAG